MPVAAGEEGEEEEGPESPDSPFSSPSTVGGDISESEDSESEDEEEPPSPVESGATETSARPVQTLGPDPTAAPSMPTSSGESDTATTSVPSFTFGAPSGGNNAAQPQITGETTLATAVRPTITSTIIKEVMPTGSPERSSSIPPVSLTPPPRNTAEPEVDGNAGPQRLPQREQEPIMTKDAMTAAIVLGVLGQSASLPLLYIVANH